MKGILVAVLSFMSIKTGLSGEAVMMLLMAMTIDYVTGLVVAWVRKELSSRTGIKGVLKKTGYFVVLSVAIIVDWTLGKAGISVGMIGDNQMGTSVLVCIWLIINEALSIIENLGKLGIPIPPPLSNAVKVLQKKQDTIK